MTFERETAGNTFATVPTRRFAFVFDPKFLPHLFAPDFSGIIALLHDLQRIDPPVRIAFLFPQYLCDADVRGYADRARSVLSTIEQPDSVPEITFSKRIPRKHRNRLPGATADGQRAVALLALCDFLQADGIVTDEPRLVEARYPILQHHRLRVIPLSECADWIEVCAHGHNVFWSATEYSRNLTVDVFYQWTHWKNSRLARWFSASTSSFAAFGVQEDMRNATLNRYPFLLYSRDMVRFYELQMDYFTRRGLQRRFSTPLGYYVSNFYLHLWGALDHLTVIAMKVLALEIERRACGIESKRFWRALAIKKPGLRTFMRSPKMVQWVSMMADMRHAAAHREMLLPTVLVEESEGYNKSDAEVSELLNREEPDFYAGLSGDARVVLEPHRIWLWKVNQLKTIATNIVVVEKVKGGYIRSPVDSVDYDLDMLNAIMDAFFVALFAKTAGGESCDESPIQSVPGSSNLNAGLAAGLYTGRRNRRRGIGAIVLELMYGIAQN